MDLAMDLIKGLLPTIVVALVVYFLVKRFLDDNVAKRELEIRKQNSAQMMPQRLQAYERLGLYLERIKPAALVRRIDPVNEDVKSYEYSLVRTIQDEWEHNLSQQIYINPATWKIIYSAKNATQNLIKQASDSLKDNSSAQDLRNHIIQFTYNEDVPSNSALLKMQIDIQGKSGGFS